MNRLQKKCLIVSTGLHLSLLGLLIVGPAFTSRTSVPEVREINFMPSMVVAENVVGGGNPLAQPRTATVAPVTPPPKPVAPPPQPKPETKLPPSHSEIVKSDPADPNDWTEKKQKKLQIVTEPRLRTRSVPPRDNSAEIAKEARKAAEAQRARERAFADAATGIKEGAASATTIDEDFGPGAGGPAYAGFASLVKYVYENAWVAPEDTSSDAAITRVKVTIARDGSVVSSEIISRSGDSQMDASVQRTLDRVRTVGHGFPEGMKDKQRTYILKFDLKVKRGLA